MVSSVYQEWEILLYTIKFGIKMAVIYDGIRVLRLIFFHKNFLISLEDLVYWMYVTIMIFQLQLEQSNGVLRGFSMLGIFLGMMIYNKLLGEKIIFQAEKWIGFSKRRLTSIKKMLKMKLCKQKRVSGINRREHGKKKNSSKKKKTESSGNDISVDDRSDLNACCGDK